MSSGSIIRDFCSVFSTKSVGNKTRLGNLCNQMEATLALAVFYSQRFKQFKVVCQGLDMPTHTLSWPSSRPLLSVWAGHRRILRPPQRHTGQRGSTQTRENNNRASKQQFSDKMIPQQWIITGHKWENTPFNLLRLQPGVMRWTCFRYYRSKFKKKIHIFKSSLHFRSDT